MPEAPAEEYMLEFFRRNGFIRKRCKIGGEFFWTLDPEQDHCNDAPCVDYYFWKIPRLRDLTVSEARRRFIEFFKRRGHEYIEPRPVVARWREDLYLTIASIVVFQPHVTSGLVPPPANPLVIVQPSIRLEDIDNVGLTLGRHLSSFEMAAHHAFNYPDKTVYWKEETVELAFDFFTKELGIPPEKITFKESWWEGGGNAGPSFEVAVGGLELATLVFMQYRVTEKGYEPIPLRIVDTGYGVERMAWFSQEVPTAFHAVYGPLMQKFRKALGVAEPPSQILWAAARRVGRLDPEDPSSIEGFYRRVSEDTGLDHREVRQILEREAALYAILDHTKTAALMLADGIVPSNTGEGYLARLVIRRALRLINRLGADTALEPLIEAQARYWAADYYPQMEQRLDYILKVVSLEEKRFVEALKRGMREVERRIRRVKTLSAEDLIQLYDSHGIPPDIVRDIGMKFGIKVEIPHNFYSLVADRHGARGVVARSIEKAKIPGDVAHWAQQFPETRRLFHEDPYMQEFAAKVLGAHGRYLVLDATAFYPRGGGQFHDTGWIELCGQRYRVVEVEKVGNVIVHILDREVDQACKGKLARGAIDWERRYKLMRHHTAVHVLLGAARRVLGDHVWQAGAEKTEHRARLDITHYELPSKDEVRKIEELANHVVVRRIPVEAIVLDRNEAERRYGFRIYQGGVPLDPKIRIIHTKDWDVEACFGTHVSNTAEIGAIKIVNVEKLQDGVVRFELVAGTEVARYAAELEEELQEAAKIVGGSTAELRKRLKKLDEEFKELRRRYQKIKSKLVEIYAKAALQNPIELEGVRVYVVREPLDEEVRQEVVKMLSEAEARAVALAYTQIGEDLVLEIGAGSEASKILDLRLLARELTKQGMRGGGRPTHVTLLARGSAARAREAVEDILKLLSKIVRRG